MRFSRILAAPLLLLFLGCSVRADEPALPLPDVLARIDTAQTNLKSGELRFTERSIAAPKQAILSGKLTFKRPNFIRIDQDRPEAQTIVSDGKTLQIFTPAAGQVLKGSWRSYLRQNRLPLPLLTFTGDATVNDWSQRYDVVFDGHVDHQYKLTLKPKDPADSAVTMWVADESFLPVRAEIAQPDGILRVDLRDIRQNITVKGSLFDLRVPENTAVVPLPS